MTFRATTASTCASAKQLSGEHPLRQPDDLRLQALLHIDWKGAEASWRMWLLAAGLHNIDPARGPRLQHGEPVQVVFDGQAWL